MNPEAAAGLMFGNTHQQLNVCFPHSEQDQSDCSGVHGGPAGGDDWLGLQGEIQQKKCFRGSLMPRTFVSA